MTPASRVVQGFSGDEGLELECIVAGDPGPEMTWYFEGMKLSNSLYYRISEDETLVITVMQRSLAGDYECVAENVVGSDSAIVTLEFAGTYV